MTIPNALAGLVIAALLVGLAVLMPRIAPKAALPAVVHNLLWAVTLVLVGSDLIEYRESTPGAWGVLFVGLLFFNLGSVLGAGLARQRSQALPLVSLDDGMPVGLISRKVLLGLLLLYGLGFAVYLYVIHSRFGLKTLVTNPTVIRGAADSYLASVPVWARLLLYIGPMLFALLLVRGGITGQLKLLTRLLLLAGLAVTMVALLQRTNLFIGATWGIAALCMAPESLLTRTFQGGATRTKSKQTGYLRAIALLALVGVVMFAAFQLVGGALGKTGEVSDGSGRVSPILQQTGMAGPFRYLTTGVPAFLLLTESANDSWPPTDQGRVLFGDFNPQTWGAATFEPIVSLVPGLKGWNSVNAFVDVGVQTNVFTWLEPFYRDFRTIGVGAGGLLLGVLLTYLYGTRRWSPRRFWIGALFLSTLFLSTFVPKINSTPYLFALILITVISAGSPALYRPRGSVSPVEAS